MVLGLGSAGISLKYPRFHEVTRCPLAVACFMKSSYLRCPPMPPSSPLSRWPDTRVSRLLALERPVVQGPFGGGLSSVALTAAVADAGGLGSFGVHHLEPADIRAIGNRAPRRDSAVVRAESLGVHARPARARDDPGAVRRGGPATRAALRRGRCRRATVPRALRLKLRQPGRGGPRRAAGSLQHGLRRSRRADPRGLQGRRNRDAGHRHDSRRGHGARSRPASTSSSLRAPRRAVIAERSWRRRRNRWSARCRWSGSLSRRSGRR